MVDRNWWPCCCNLEGCECCHPGTVAGRGNIGKWPVRWQVTIADITGDSCCANYNGTFLLDELVSILHTPGFTDHCFVHKTGISPAACCGNNMIQLRMICPVVPHYNMTMYFATDDGLGSSPPGFPAGHVNASKNIGGISERPDCSAINFTTGLVGGDVGVVCGATCDYSIATVNIRAI